MCLFHIHLKKKKKNYLFQPLLQVKFATWPGFYLAEASAWCKREKASISHGAEAAGRKKRIFWQAWWQRKFVFPGQVWQVCRHRECPRGWWQWHIATCSSYNGPMELGSFVPRYLASERGFPSLPEALHSSIFFFNKQPSFCLHLLEDYVACRFFWCTQKYIHQLTRRTHTIKMLTEVYENRDFNKYELH